ncbi:MAG TPA: phosphotransferase, partial [Ktedonobacterales bacterium]
VVRDRAGKGGDLIHALYAALQLAEHFSGDEPVRAAVVGLLGELRGIYAHSETTARWDLMSHTLVLRLLLTFYGDAEFTRAVAACFLRAAEQRHDAEQDLLEQELQTIVKERMTIQLGKVKELTGGFTDDRVYRVPFSYWFPGPGGDAARRDGLGGVGGVDGLSGLERPGVTSMIVKRSTRDAFLEATEHYNQLPPPLRSLFVRLPSEAQVHKSGRSSSYYLVMEDLTSLYTFRHLFNEFDQRAMAEHHRVLLERATALACEAVFRMFRLTRSPRANFPGTQLARLYLSPIEAKLTRAVERVPWLKNPLDGFHANEQRYKGLDYYLGIVTKHASRLAPRALGLAHGDYHSRNIMLDRDCTGLKLIDLDKLTSAGDYLADLATLLQDVSVYRRVSEPDRDFGLPREQIVFAASASAEAGTVENAVRYPALGRSASLFLQERLLDAAEHFAAEMDDADWKPRFWLATATAVLMRLAFQREKEPAAVLYAEGVRLLHDLSRHLEQGQPLPALLFPAEWPESPLARAATPDELPEWARASDLVRALHESFRQMGLRAEYDRGAVRYYAAEAGDGPVAALTAAHRDALARLLLCGEAPDGALPAGVRLQPGGKAGERLRTTLLVGAEANASALVNLARAGLAGVLGKRAGAATRRRG